LLLLLLLLLLLCCLGGLLYYLFWYRDDDGNGGGTSQTTPPVVQTTAGPPPTTAGPPPTSAPPTSAPPTSAPPTTTPPEPQLITMPSVVGKSGSDADEMLKDLGFTNITFIDRDNPGGPVQQLADWTVRTQSVGAGTEVAADTPIELRVTTDDGGRG
jgi:hypothetical protein